MEIIVDANQHKSLVDFANDVETNAQSREAFLRAPLETIRSALQLKTKGQADTSVANEILLSVLRQPALAAKLATISKRHSNGEIDVIEMRSQTAKALAEDLPNDTKKKIGVDWLQNPPGANLAPEMMVNLIAHVDIVVVVTEAAVFNSEAFFNGRYDGGSKELQKIANAISGAK